VAATSYPDLSGAGRELHISRLLGSCSLAFVAVLLQFFSFFLSAPGRQEIISSSLVPSVRQNAHANII